MTDSSETRRRFFHTLAAAAATASLAQSLGGQERVSGTPTWDLSFLDRLNGVHKQVFDCGDLNALPLHVVGNWYRAHREVFGLEPRRLSAIVAIAMRAFPLNAADTLWQRYPIGRMWEVRDPRTGEYATRNVFAEITARDRERNPRLNPDDSVTALAAKGTIFWQCNNALNGVIATLAAEMKQDPQVVAKEVRAGLFPHVIIVPAHTMAIGLAQEKGCTYEAL